MTDPGTGLIDGYRVPGADPGHIYYRRPGGWLTSYDLEGSRLLLDRKTGRSWRWPRSYGGIRLLKASEEHLLFEDLDSAWPYYTGRFTVVNRDMKEVARFSLDTEGADPLVRFSPDGQTIALGTKDRVYLVPVESARPTVLFEAQVGDEGPQRLLLGGQGWAPPRIRLSVTHAGRTTYPYSDVLYFTWDGIRAPGPACEGLRSPDGRFVAQVTGGAFHWTGLVVRDDGSIYREDRGYHPGDASGGPPWSTVVIAAADTCTPILRVQSAHRVSSGTWPHNWLSTGDGLVVGVHDGYAILRIPPSPDLISLPASRPGGPPSGAPAERGSQAAPTGGGRYMAYGPGVYDVDEERWSGPGEVSWGESWWGDTHRERWFTIREFRGGVEHRQILLPPKIQLPPFDDEIALRVAGTGGCLALREEPGTDNPTRECLPDGERLILAEPDTPRDDSRPFHTSIGVAEAALWVHVRTEDRRRGLGEPRLPGARLSRAEAGGRPQSSSSSKNSSGIRTNSG